MYGHQRERNGCEMIGRDKMTYLGVVSRLEKR